MLQLKNSTPFRPTIAVFPNEDGIDTLYVLVKATFQLGATLTVADEQVPPTFADEYWGEPGASSLKYASEMHLCKPSTDVVLVGQAWATRPPKVPQIDVTLSVAERKKVIRVFGNRQWKANSSGLSMTPPEPFESMPIIYERAYGGVHVVDSGKPEVLAEDRNPIGVGFLGKRDPRSLAGQPVPNVEDPKQLIKSPADAVPPAGFGFIAPSWQPRRSFAGTYDEAWMKNRAPYLPQDFNPRFFNVAHPDLIFDRYVQGGEPVRIINASPNGPLEFQLPACSFEVKVKVAGRTDAPLLNLETALIAPDQSRLCLTWRGALPCDKQALRIETIDVGLRQSLA